MLIGRRVTRANFPELCPGNRTAMIMGAGRGADDTDSNLPTGEAINWARSFAAGRHFLENPTASAMSRNPPPACRKRPYTELRFGLIAAMTRVRRRLKNPTTSFAGTYVTGWIKRGPRGVIGSNKQRAAETVRALRSDVRAGRLANPTFDPEHFIELLRAATRSRRLPHLEADRSLQTHPRARRRAAAQAVHGGRHAVVRRWRRRLIRRLAIKIRVRYSVTILPPHRGSGDQLHQCR